MNLTGKTMKNCVKKMNTVSPPKSRCAFCQQSTSPRVTESKEVLQKVKSGA